VVYLSCLAFGASRFRKDGVVGALIPGVFGLACRDLNLWRVNGTSDDYLSLCAGFGC